MRFAMPRFLLTLLGAALLSLSVSAADLPKVYRDLWYGQPRAELLKTGKFQPNKDGTLSFRDTFAQIEVEGEIGFDDANKLVGVHLTFDPSDDADLVLAALVKNQFIPLTLRDSQNEIDAIAFFANGGKQESFAKAINTAIYNNDLTAVLATGITRDPANTSAQNVAARLKPSDRIAVFTLSGEEMTVVFTNIDGLKLLMNERNKAAADKF
ncbi:hypothetical protein ACFSM5_21385 [Lacibacterium aquatile]|uniref:Uncharacterized protein n=1 Tax=Lacibacterium aquatile TaxID=1168082 RepID=A0ABW5E0B1_9PROT